MPRNERLKPSDDSIVDACSIRPGDTDRMYPRNPQGPTDIAVDSARAEFGDRERGGNYTPEGRWIDATVVSVSYVKRRLDALVDEGRLLCGTPERMGVRFRMRRRGAKSAILYGTPELVKANRRATLAHLRKSARDEATKKATADLIKKHKAEHSKLIEKHYVDPVAKYPIEPPA